MCGNCKYIDDDANTNDSPCNTCIIWEDGYLRFRNYEWKRFSCDDFEDEQ